MKECYLYSKLENLKTKCNLCNHKCVIANGKTGKCFVRKNIDGSLYSLVYDKLVAEHIDSIEKKPLFHFLPGSYSYSIATAGCNFRCFFCQNYEISQLSLEDHQIPGYLSTPEEIVARALKNNCKSISYTYTEPTVYFELAYDTSILAKRNGLRNVFVTNGYMTTEAIDMLKGYLDAANIDLKGFSEEFYRKYTGAKLKPVLENISYMRSLGIWIEVTTLLIPGLNDSEEELVNIAQFLKGVSIEIPWHISAYFPNYKSTIPPTSPAKVLKAVNIGKKIGLKYVYGGNIYSSDAENTKCPKCGENIIIRKDYSIFRNDIENNLCKNCGEYISGVF